jgi:hypothetical protein
MGLIAFDLKQIITPLFHNGPGVLTLAVQGITGDDLPIQCWQGGQQFGRRAEFTAFGAFLLVVNGQGLRGAILLLGQGEQANVVANHFAVQGQRLRQGARPALEPAVEAQGKSFWIHPGQHLIEDPVAGNFPESLGAPLAR